MRCKSPGSEKSSLLFDRTLLSAKLQFLLRAQSSSMPRLPEFLRQNFRVSPEIASTPSAAAFRKAWATTEEATMLSIICRTIRAIRATLCCTGTENEDSEAEMGIRVTREVLVEVEGGGDEAPQLSPLSFERTRRHSEDLGCLHQREIGTRPWSTTW